MSMGHIEMGPRQIPDLRLHWGVMIGPQYYYLGSHSEAQTSDTKHEAKRGDHWAASMETRSPSL